METVSTTMNKQLQTLQTEAGALKDTIDVRNKWLSSDENKSRFNYAAVASNTQSMQRNYDEILLKIEKLQNGNS